MHSSLKAARSRADLSHVRTRRAVRRCNRHDLRDRTRGSVPQARTLHKLARALGVDPAALIKEEKIAV